MSEVIKKVLANVAQLLTPAEKALARSNIDAASSVDVTAAKTIVEQGSGITVTETTGEGGRSVYTVTNAKPNVKGNWTETNSEAESYIQNKPGLATQSTDGFMSSTDKTKLDGIEAGAEVNVQSDWTQTSSSADDYIKNKPQNLVQDANYVHTDNNFTTALKDKLEGIAAGAEVNVQADWNESNSSSDAYIQNKPANLVQDANYVHTDNNFTTTLKNKLDGIEAGAEVNVNADWNATSGDAEILNKPANLVQDASYVHTDNNFTTALKDKLDGIAAGAEVNVQSDWTQTVTTADDYIKNKPADLVQDVNYVHTDNNFTTALKDKLDGIAAGAEVNVNADWNATSGDAEILNKPANLVQDANYVHTDNNFTTTLKDKLDGIAAGAEVNVQADWNQTDSSADDYIRNKPSPVTVMINYGDTSRTIAQLEALITGGTEVLVKQSYLSSGINYDVLYRPVFIAESSEIVFTCINDVDGNKVGAKEVTYGYYQGTPTWRQRADRTIEGLPTHSTTTAGKYLQVNSSGNAEWLDLPANLVQDASYVHTDNNFTTTLKDKLDGIAAGAEVNVQSDWTQTSSSADDYIKNKPNLAAVATSGSYNDLTNTPAESALAAGSNITITEAGSVVTISAASQVNSDWNASSGVAEILNKPTLATVATSGSYNDLSNKPTIPAAQVNSDWNASSGVAEILNKPTLATVATSGSYNDLSNKPTIPAAQVNSDWNASSGIAEILNKPTLATVATSGSYNDLSNTPSLATVATSGSYNDLTNKPSIPAAQVNSDWNAVSGVAQILNKPSLATVATSGSYNDLSNKPTIPAAQVNSDWNASSGIAQILNKPSLAAVATSGSYSDLSNKPTIPAAQVNSDWNASSGIAQILNKPTLAYIPYGGSATGITNLTFDLDDAEGYHLAKVNNGGIGYLVNGPYKILLDSGINNGSGIGDTTKPVYVDTDGVFKECSLNDIELIQFNFSNTTTAQDSVYIAIYNAYQNGKTPVLWCNVANGVMYWFPSASGATSYSFARCAAGYVYVASMDTYSHIMSINIREIKDFTAGTNISIDANNQISATDTTYTAGSGISISSQNVISNAMHEDTYGVMITYNSLSTSGSTTLSLGKWRIRLDKLAMLTWSNGSSGSESVRVFFSHTDYSSGTIDNGRIQVITYCPWRDGSFTDVYTGHNQWSFDGSTNQGGSNNGFPLYFVSPDYNDNSAKTCPKFMPGFKFIVGCGITSADWLEISFEPLYVTTSTSLSSNAARVLIRAKYFYS